MGNLCCGIKGPGSPANSTSFESRILDSRRTNFTTQNRYSSSGETVVQTQTIRQPSHVHHNNYINIIDDQQRQENAIPFTEARDEIRKRALIEAQNRHQLDVDNQRRQENAINFTDGRDEIRKRALIEAQKRQKLRLQQLGNQNIIHDQRRQENAIYFKEQMKSRDEIRKKALMESKKRRQLLDQQENEKLFKNLTIQEPERVILPNLKIIHKPILTSDFLKGFGDSPDNKAIITIELEEGSRQYERVKYKFTNTNKKLFKVKRILEVYNPYLLLQYKLKKMQYRRYGHVDEMELFHGTLAQNVDSICRNNFNWRLTGSSTGHKFGQGVSFSPISNYATHYGDNTFNKVMFLVKVLVSKKCVGAKQMILPPEGYDTTTNHTEQVWVKFEDNSFYPTYVIHYGGIDYLKRKTRSNSD